VQEVLVRDNNTTLKFSQFLSEESSLKIEPSFSDRESWLQENKVLFEEDNAPAEHIFNMNPLTPKEISSD